MEVPLLAARACEALWFVGGVDVFVGGYRLNFVSRPADDSIAQLEHQLEGAERTLSGLRTLDAQQADRVAHRMDRLASQLLEISAPPTIDAMHQRLGIAPVGPDELESLAHQIGARDGAG